MDLSGLKWPLIIAVIVLVGWLFTSGGVNFMIKNFTESTPGADAEQDKIDEAGLSRVGGYLLYLWRWDKAAEVFQTALDRYPQGANAWYNYYRLARCHERKGRYQETFNILNQLISVDAHKIDERVPHIDNLRLQAKKLQELHELK